MTKIRLFAFAAALLSVSMTANAQLNPAEEGRRVWLANNCYGCHGVRAGGASFNAPPFRSENPELGDLKEVLRQGGDNGMPAFPKLTATDAANLFAYLRSLGTSTEPTFLRWWEVVPTASLRPRPGTKPVIAASLKATKR
jgi:mono/diheme cytochrome c family protein